MISLPVVGTLVGTARAVVDGAVSTALFALSVPARVDALLGEVESLVTRIDAVVAGAASTVDDAAAIVARTAEIVASAGAAVAQANAVIGSTTGVVEQARGVARDAETVVASAGRTSDAASELLDTYAPLARQAAPLATQFIEELSPDEVHAAVLMLDRLPEIAERMDSLLPILATLETVSPEIHELLGVAKDVRQAIVGVPGFSFLRRRGEEKENGDND